MYVFLLNTTVVVVTVVVIIVVLRMVKDLLAPREFVIF